MESSLCCLLSVDYFVNKFVRHHRGLAVYFVILNCLTGRLDKLQNWRLQLSCSINLNFMTLPSFISHGRQRSENMSEISSCSMLILSYSFSVLIFDLNTCCWRFVIQYSSRIGRGVSEMISADDFQYWSVECCTKIKHFFRSYFVIRQTLSYHPTLTWFSFYAPDSRGTWPATCRVFIQRPGRAKKKSGYEVAVALVNVV